MKQKLFFVLVAAVIFLSGKAWAISNDEANARILSTLDLPQSYLAYIKVTEEGGWYAQNIDSKSDLDQILLQEKQSPGGWIIPVFQTVASPGEAFESCKPYYDYILRESGIKKHDKVLVIGSGSGSDVWAAWLKNKDTIFAVDINPLAVANTRATAQIGQFPVDVIQGDIRTMTWPDRFKDFDFVLWNMPFMAQDPSCKYDAANFITCDGGDVLESFLTLFPKLLKKGGKAIFLNSPQAASRVHFKEQEVIAGQDSVVFVVTND